MPTAAAQNRAVLRKNNNFAAQKRIKKINSDMSSKFSLIFCGVLLFLNGVYAQQAERWQQRVEYSMDIEMDVQSHRFEGKQKLVYFNNSPDVLDRVFYHLYFNAFQPNSMMDVRSRTLPDPDRRVGSRISELTPDEIGYLRVRSLEQDGQAVSWEESGTILEVTLAEPLLPGEQTVLEMEFSGQVPLQVRRSGRDSEEGISYSMSQWYPKLCEYDYQGWHANPYVGREFHGVWGDFDVRITIDPEYVIGATGYLQNPEEIGHGYVDSKNEKTRRTGKQLTWHFVAPQVHDFVWGADPDYTHTSMQAADGPMMHFFYQKTEENAEAWENLPRIMDVVFSYVNQRFGKYPYDQYSFIQGGDGGMEYPMATLITGNRPLPSLVGVSVHELMHSWYQGVLATNESLYSWMDEGFTSFATSEVMNMLKGRQLIPGKAVAQPQNHAGYIALASSGLEEPLSTHADHFQTSFAYWRSAYDKGKAFLTQIAYIIGEEAFSQGLLDYFNTWKFRHPNANDFIRVMEKASGIELDWYKEYMVNSTHTIDYRIGALTDTTGGMSVLNLHRDGNMPMPLDVLITYRNGNTEMISIPLRIMRGAKASEFPDSPYRVAEDWPWTHPDYQLLIESPASEIAEIEIDPSRRMADVDVANNRKSFSEKGEE